MDLKTYVKRVGIEAEFFEPGVEMATVEASAKALGVSPDEILKSLLFQAKNGEFVLVVAAGNARVSTKKLSEVTGLKGVRLAKPEVVFEVTGYPAGGTPPIGHKRRLRVIVDGKAAQLPYAYGGGGRPSVMVKLRLEDIIRSTGAEIHDIVD